MADRYQFRQKPIAAFLAALRIPARAPETRQEPKKQQEAHQPMIEVEQTAQSAESSDWLSSLDWGNTDQAPAIPVFDGEPKREQASLVKTIGARLAEARELCNMSQSAAAKRLGYSNPSKLSKVEGATDTNSVPLWLIKRAARLYDVSIDFLLGESDDFEAGLQRGVQTWLLDAWQAHRLQDMAALEALHRRVSAVTSLLPLIAAEAERTAEAIQRFSEINTEFDEMRGGARLVATAENLTRLARDASATVRRFRIEIGVDRSNPTTT